MKTLLATGFRPFFLLAAVHAVASIALWAAMIAGVLPPAAEPTVFWHVHEMLFGFTPAVVAGFLLTAVPNWTSTAPLSGRWLALLVAAWLAGRVATWNLVPGTLHTIAVLGALLFLPALAVAVARPILGEGNRRNYAMPVLLLVLAGAQAMFLIGDHPVRAETLALDIYLVMLLVVGGRITPLFTRNWLKRNGLPADDVGSPMPLDRIALAAVLVAAALAQFDVPLRLVGTACLAAAALQAARLPFWRGWRALRDPLVVVLHLGHAWIVLALLLRGGGLMTAGIPNRAWMHALGIGAMGTLIIGVMARVTLGHTGRPLQVSGLTAFAFGGISLAALLRTLVAVGTLPRDPVLEASALAWIVAFLLFGLSFYRPLTRPRVDGRPG
ncbi:NnrS family protein [Halomonas denitrificans]|nr:NnrS family protein [Halomonas denitrificans]